MLDRTRKCPICGRPYKVFSMYAGDQSACPSCRAEAERQISKPNSHEQEVWDRRRKKAFES